MHLSSHPRPSIPPPACRHPHALFSAPAGLPRGKPKNPLRSSSICYNPHTHPPYQPAKHPSPASPSCPGPRACLPQPPTFSPCRPPCAPAAALQHPLLPAPHPATEHQHQHHWKPHPAPSTYCPPEPPGESPPGHRPAAQPTAPTLRSPPHLAPAPVPKTPTPPRCLSFSYPGVNRQALHHLLTSATAPAAPPPHLHLLASGHRPLPSPPAPARSPVATHLFVLSALAGDVSFQFVTPTPPSYPPGKPPNPPPPPHFCYPSLPRPSTRGEQHLPTLARAPILASSSGTRPVSRRQIIQATGPLPAPALASSSGAGPSGPARLETRPPLGRQPTVLFRISCSPRCVRRPS